MIKLNTLVFSFLFLSASLFATENNPYQTSDTIRLDEVIVTGTMPKVNLRNVPMSVSVVSAKQIENRLEPSILPLLTEEVPGLFVTQRGIMGYGVAAGAAGGMSIRGIGGAPTSGVLVLIDGHPQYMGLMGHPLADSYQSMMTERVEVVRGPASVLYGSNAMGGVINIITKKQKRNGIHNSAQLMYGSYNTFSAETSTGYRQVKFHADAALGYNRSDGHRDNMDFSQINGYGKLGYDFTTNWTGFADLNLTKTKSSNPGTIQAPMIDNDADITRGMTSLAIENEYANTSGAVKFFYNFGKHVINDGYAINDANAQPKIYRFNSNDQMLGLSVYQSYSFFEGNKTTAGFDFQRFGGKAWNQFPDPANNKQLADVHLNDVAGYINVQQTVLDNKLTMNAGLRLDHHEINGSEWIPQFGLSFTPSATTVLKAIVSKGYRNPTIREMYMFPPQNPDLKPERLMNYEISFLQTLMDNKMSIGANVFYIKGDNIIQLTFTEGKPLYLNTGEIENKGFELTSSYQATNNLQFSANYSFLDMKYKILASPEHKLYVGGNYTQGRWNFSTGLQYIGNLYTKINPEPVKNSFTLWNARINFKATDWLNVFVRGENLLGQTYEINYGYPMPKTTIFGGIRLHF